MKQKLLSLFFVLTCLIGVSFAQNRQVSGKVTSAIDGSPIAGVSVSAVGTSFATQTDASGNYSFSVPEGATLNVSFIGYAAQRIKLGASNVVNVQLVAEDNALEEVVVTAIGITREAKSLGYGATTINSDDLTRARESNIINALAGKAPGVRVTSQSGTVGGSSKVVIRGVNSLDGGSPLWVIDGTPISDNTSAGGTTARNIDFGNRVGDLSSDDIESMTILKGAAATALYGSRAKDGAVIINTKKGKKGTVSSVSFNSSTRFDNPLVLPEFQNEYAQGNFNTTTKEYDYSLKYLNGWGPKIQGQTVTDFAGDQVQLMAYKNNVRDFYETGISAINNVSFAGGGEKSDYRFSFTSTNEKGIIPGNKQDKYNVSVNSGTSFNDKLSSRFSATYSNISADGRPAQSSNNTNILTSVINGLPRVLDIAKVKANFQDPITGGQIFLGTDKDANNPYWIINYNKNSNKVDRFFGTYNLTYTPVEWLTFSNNLGGDVFREKRASVVKKGTAGFMNGAFYTTDLFSRQINNDLIATIEQNNLVEDFKFKLIVGNNINDRLQEATRVEAENLTIDELYTYSNAASKTPFRDYTHQRIIGLYGDFGISYKDYLFLNVTGRNDWSSTLPLENRSYFYPSVSGSFVFSEAISELPEWLSFGKLRASWAQVGSDLRPYQLDYQYDPVSTVFMQYVGSQTTVFPFSDIATAFTGPRILPNASLKPQRQNSFEVGADLRFLNSRVNLDFNYYNTVTRDQLIPVDVAISTGYFAKWVNVGAIRNKGVEVLLNVVPVKTQNFKWDVDFNFSRNKQVVEELTDDPDFQYNAASGWSGLQIKAEVGQSFGIYGKAFLRDDATGKYIINAESGLRELGDVERLGNLFPDWMLGINNTFSYKSFSLSALLDIRHGGNFYSGTVANLRTSGLAVETGGDRSVPIIEDGLVDKGNGLVQNDVAVRSHQDYWSQNYKVANTEANIFDASYIKLREIRFDYSLPASILSGQKAFKSASIGIEGRNLWLIKSNVPHVDPESSFFGAGSVGEAVEFQSVPSTRSFGFNLRFGF